jgi:hypothetical protein
MSDQCNTCGSHKDIEPCPQCSTIICAHCKLNHVPLCAELQKRKRRNEGPTIANVPVPQHRRGHETPETTGPDRTLTKSPVLGAPYTFTPPLVSAEPNGLLEPIDPADQALVNEVITGIADFLSGSEEPKWAEKVYEQAKDNGGLWAYVGSVSAEPVNHGLDAVKDLLSE